MSLRRASHGDRRLRSGSVNAPAGRLSRKSYPRLALLQSGSVLVDDDGAGSASAGQWSANEINAPNVNRMRRMLP
jgi:hypothetical protein